MNVSDEIVFNVIKDWEKKRVSPENKAEFIKAYLKEKNISQRELGRRLGINKSTINDWVTGRQRTKYYNYKNNEIYCISDRLTFLLFKKRIVDDKEKYKLIELKNEIEKILNR